MSFTSKLLAAGVKPSVSKNVSAVKKHASKTSGKKAVAKKW